MRANTQTLRNLRNRITPLRDLGNRIPLEIVTEIYPAHLHLLTSKLGKKVSRNLGAIQTSALVDKGMLVAKSHRAPLRLAFPASAAERWLPLLYPADVTGGRND